MSKENKAYNGYANYQTWNLSLWLDNEYHINKEVEELVEREQLTVESLAIIAYTNFPEGTPDFDGPQDYAYIDWQELVAGYTSGRFGEITRPANLLHILIESPLSHIRCQHAEDIKDHFDLDLVIGDDGFMYLDDIRVSSGATLRELIDWTEKDLPIFMETNEDGERLYFYKDELISHAQREDIKISVHNDFIYLYPSDGESRRLQRIGTL